MLFGQLFLTNDSFLEKTNIAQIQDKALAHFSTAVSICSPEKQTYLLENRGQIKKGNEKKQLYLPTIKYPLFLEEEFPPLQCVLLRPDCPCSQIKGGCQTPHYQTHKLEKSFRMPSGVPGKLLDSPVSKKQTNKTGQMGVDARL